MEKIVEVVLTKKKETKGTVVYEADNDNGNIVFYLPKPYLSGKRPTSIKMTIEA